MIRRLLLIAVVTASLLAAVAPGLATMASNDGSATGWLDVAYAGDVDATPTPTATPAQPNGSCQSGGHCGG